MLNSINKFNGDAKFVKAVANCFIKVGILRDEEGRLACYSTAVGTFNKMAPCNDFRNPDKVVQGSDDFIPTNQIRCNEITELVHVYSRNSCTTLGANFTQNNELGDENTDVNDGEVVLGIRSEVTPTNPVQVTNSESVNGNSSIAVSNVDEPLLELYLNVDSLKKIKSKKPLIDMLLLRGYTDHQFTHVKKLDILKQHLVEWCISENNRRMKISTPQQK